jgi:TolB-like protein
MSRDPKRPRSETASAAEWFVALDSSPSDEVGAARFAAWLDRAAEHEVELERCDAAVEIARGLADDPELRWAYDEAAAIANRDPAASRRAVARRTLRRFGWAGGLATASLAAVAAFWLARETRGPTLSPALAHLPTVADSVARTPSAELGAGTPSAELGASIAAAAAAYPIARLPSGVVVDASSVAVLPFTAPADEGRATRVLAASLSRDIGSALAALPGVYVVGEPRAAAYLGTDLDASELGEQLGVRGVVVGELTEHDGQIRVAAELLDAATDERLWQAEYERPADDVAALADEIGGEITAALIDPVHRARAAAAPSFHDARADNRTASTRPDFALQ